MHVERVSGSEAVFDALAPTLLADEARHNLPLGILATARGLFASSGYAGTSMRAVGSGAGVDAALVHHYFGSKDDLFLAALELPIDPRAALAPVVEGGRDGAGERLLRVFVGVWDDERHQPSLLALVTSPGPLG